MMDQGKTPPLFGKDGLPNNWMRISINAPEQISGLRKKLANSDVHIVTVRGLGYMLEVLEAESGVS